MNKGTVIIGGGLSGICCGISLARRGQQVTIVGGAQSSLMLNSGSMELLGCINGIPVTSPLQAIPTLPHDHPYSKIGAQRIAELATRAKQLLIDANINMEGNADLNHWRITPMGIAKPAWLTLSDHLHIDDMTALPARHLALMNIRGYLDQPNAMLAQGLRNLGFDVEVIEFTTDDITALRRSPTEMRATSLAKRLISYKALKRIADQINNLANEADMVLLPSVLAQNDDSDILSLQSMVNKPLRLVATLPPSVAGMRMQAQLRHYFKMLGGNFLMGDSAIGGNFDGDRLVSINTAKQADTPLLADNFVLATGSFISRGLIADHEHIYEPVLGVDVDADADRALWTCFNVLEPQAYNRYGVATDDSFHCLKQGRVIDNLYAIGSILSGHDAIKMGDGTGVAMLTAITAADLIRLTPPHA